MAKVRMSSLNIEPLHAFKHFGMAAACASSMMAIIAIAEMPMILLLAGASAYRITTYMSYFARYAPDRHFCHHRRRTTMRYRTPAITRK